MDSRGIPIVIPAKRCNTTPKRITTPKRYDTPLSPFFMRNIKNELSLLEAYDDFYDSRFSSRYHPTSDDMRHNVRDLYKSNMFTEISSPKPPKRMRSSFFMDSDMMEEEEEDELPHLEASKKPLKDMTVSSPMEAMTPLADDAFDTLHDAPSVDLNLHQQQQQQTCTPSLAPCPAFIPKSTAKSPAAKRKTRAKRAKQDEALVEQPSQPHQLESVTPKSLLKHQKQIKSAPQTPCPAAAAAAAAPTPLSFDNSVNEMPTTRLKSSAASSKPSMKSSAAAAKSAQVASPQRLTRRQARLIEENGGKADFSVPEAIPPAPPSKRKGKGKSPKRKPSLPRQVDISHPVEEAAIVHQEPPIIDDNNISTPETPIVDDDNIIALEPPIIDNDNNITLPEPSATIEPIQQTSPCKVVNAKEDVTDVSMHDLPDAAEAEAAEAAEALEAITTTEIKAPQETQVESTHHHRHKADDKSEKELIQQEKLRAYRKKKSDAEIQQILEAFPQLAHYYQLIERAGSGTFSRVYKAKDLLVGEYMPSSQANKVADVLKKDGDDDDTHYVAIKLIFDISTPERVANEIRCLSMLADSPGVTPLITAFRHEGLTFVVLPYIQFDHFDDFYRDMTANDVRNYISELLIGLKSLHDKGYMHRDVKPGNFLYNVKSKAGYLADFGLARASSLKTAKPHTNSSNHPKVKNTQYTQKEDEIGYYAYDSRSSLQADRSGTKGFRAPEVMLRYRYQTSAIDIWAVGVILLTILSGQYPIFEPEDDANGIIELAHVFGMKQLKAFTEYYGRTMHTNIPTIPEDPVDLDTFCRDINKKGACITTWNPQDYTAAVDLMKQCLQLIHTNRPTAADALNHPFFSQS